LRRVFTRERPPVTPLSLGLTLSTLPALATLPPPLGSALGMAGLAEAVGQGLNLTKDAWGRVPVVGSAVQQLPYVRVPSSVMTPNLQWLSERLRPELRTETYQTLSERPVRYPAAAREQFDREPPVRPGPMPGTAVRAPVRQTETRARRTFSLGGVPLLSWPTEPPRFRGDLSQAIGIMEQAMRSGSPHPVHGPPIPDWLRSRPSGTPAQPSGPGWKWDPNEVVARLESGEMPPWMDQFRQELSSSQAYDPGNPETSVNLMRELMRANGIPEEQQGLFALMEKHAPLIAREYVLVGGVDGEPMLSAAYLPDYMQLYLDLARAPLGHPAATREVERIKQSMREQWVQALARKDDPKSIFGYVRGEIQAAAESGRFTGNEADIIWETLIAPYLHAMGADDQTMEARRVHLQRLYEKWRDEATTGNPGAFLDWLLANGLDPEAMFLGIEA
jgi:hypothetical protein